MKGEKVELMAFDRNVISDLVKWRNNPDVPYWATGSKPLHELTNEKEMNLSFTSNIENTSKFDIYMIPIYTLDR